MTARARESGGEAFHLETFRVVKHFVVLRYMARVNDIQMLSRFCILKETHNFDTNPSHLTCKILLFGKLS